MNTLILLVYLASVSQNLNQVAPFLALVLGVFGLIFFMFYHLSLSESNHVHESTQNLKLAAKYSFVGSVFAILLYIVSPSAGTIYTMAGLKSGEKIAQISSQNEIVQKALKLLNLKLDEMIRNKSNGGRL